MIPDRLLDIKYELPEYFDKQYPFTNDCIKLDKQIQDIQVDIDIILKADLADRYEGNWFEGRFLRKKARTYLQDLLLKKNNLSTKNNCRNQIELTRQEESAQTFTDYATKSDSDVIGLSNKKQLAYVLMGSVVILTSVYLFTAKK